MRETYNDRSPPRSFGCVSCACAPMPMLAIEVRRRDVKSFMLAGYWFNLVCMRYVWCVSVSFQSMILSMCAGAGVWVRRRACSFWIFLFIGFLLFIYEHCGYLQDLVLHLGTRVGILLDLGVGYIRTLLTLVWYRVRPNPSGHRLISPWYEYRIWFWSLGIFIFYLG